MSNSTLVTYTRISPKKSSPRNHAIDTITIHCIVGQWTAKQGCDYFATTDRECSANYVVGKDGSIGLSVDEKDRSWCTSSRDNDNRAVTIEVASDTKHPYAVTDAAYNALIKLVADICQRNGIKKLLWKADKSIIGQVDKQNMTVHRWFANKSCPGEYLYERHSDIAAKVNKILGAVEQDLPAPVRTLYRVQVGAYSKRENADRQLAAVQAKGFDAFITWADGLYKVQIGAYSVKANADAQFSWIKAAGFSDAFISTAGGGTVVATAPTLKSEEEVAKEVIQGKWGNGTDRKKALMEAGYDYTTVQAKVNALLS